jgi:hypothetical protein
MKAKLQLTVLFFYIVKSSFSSVLAPGNFSTSLSVTSTVPDTIRNITNPYNYDPLLITELPSQVKETSGLVFFDDMLWTINDGGNPAELYQLDPVSGKVLRSVVVINTTNIDWESMTQDSLNIYIGDFGNNSGTRNDLRILKIKKSYLKDPASNAVKASIVYFQYPDQKEFKPASNNTNFDCEAFFCYNDSLHLFSKNWTDQQTKHYIIPAKAGNYQARLAEVFIADGLITDASINKQGNIVLLGYRNTGGKFWECFLWVISGYTNSNFFGGNKKRIELGSALQVGQSEGIILNDDNTAWLSSESIQAGILFFPAKLFGMDLNSYFMTQNKPDSK